MSYCRVINDQCRLKLFLVFWSVLNKSCSYRKLGDLRVCDMADTPPTLTHTLKQQGSSLSFFSEMNSWRQKPTHLWSTPLWWYNRKWRKLFTSLRMWVFLVLELQLFWWFEMDAVLRKALGALSLVSKHSTNIKVCLILEGNQSSNRLCLRFNLQRRHIQ